mgnify:FL=1
MIKEIIKYAVIIIASFAAGWIFKPKQIAKPTPCPECPVCPVQADTCFIIEAADTITLPKIIKPGKKTKSETIVPILEETTVTTDNNKIEEVNVYTKEFNNGITWVGDTITVKGSKIIDWKRSSKLDEVEVNKLIKVVEKIKIEQQLGPIREVPKLVYMPQRFISLGMNSTYDANGDWDYGILGGWQTKSGLHVEGGYSKNKVINGKLSFPIIKFKQKN